MDEKRLLELVDEQANDADLWFLDAGPREEALQDAIRKLHEIIEGKTSVECALEAMGTSFP